MSSLRCCFLCALYTAQTGPSQRSANLGASSTVKDSVIRFVHDLHIVYPTSALIVDFTVSNLHTFRKLSHIPQSFRYVYWHIFCVQFFWDTLSSLTGYARCFLWGFLGQQPRCPQSQPLGTVELLPKTSVTRGNDTEGGTSGKVELECSTKLVFCDVSGM